MFLNALLVHRNNLRITFFITVFCFSLTYLLFGFYYVESEGLSSSFFSGKLTPSLPFRSLYFSGTLGISYLYSVLYEYVPTVEWLSWVYLTYLFVSCFIGLLMVVILLPEKTSTPVKIILQVVVYYFVFADHHIHYILTRVSYMMCGVSLIGLVVFFNTSPYLKSRCWLFLLFNLLFTIGALTRVEAAIASFLLILAFGLFYLQNIRQCVFLFLYPFVVVSAISVALTVDIKTATSREFYKQVEPDIEEQFIARENSAPLSKMKTHRDSILYKTALDMMWSDPKIISPQFLRSLILPEKFIFTDARQWDRVHRNFSDILWKYWYLVIATLLFSLCIYIQHSFSKSFISAIYGAGFLVSFWLLIGVQIYTDKVNERSFMPFISLFILCHVILLARSINFRFSLWLYPLLGVCMILFIVHVKNLKIEANILKEDLLKYQSNFKKIKLAASNKFLVLNSTSFDYIFLSNVPFHPFDYSAFKKIYITDGYIIPFLPYYKRYLERDCQCDIYAFPSFWTYLKSIRKEVVIVSAPHRMQVVKEYLEEIHQFPLPIVEVKSVQLLDQRKSDERDVPDEMKMYVFENN